MEENRGALLYIVVLMLSNGVTARTDSKTPAPKPAITVLGLERLPFASWSNPLIWSNTINPIQISVSNYWWLRVIFEQHSLTPALIEFPMIRAVHPAYHSAPNFGQGNFCACDNRWLSCARVFATKSVWVHPQKNISTRQRVLRW